MTEKKVSIVEFLKSHCDLDDLLKGNPQELNVSFVYKDKLESVVIIIKK